METGMGAGGATALAQAALQSKKGVSANIEQQEAANEKLKAQGQSQLEQLKMQEAQRVQGIQMTEAQRLQQADIAGKQFDIREHVAHVSDTRYVPLRDVAVERSRTHEHTTHVRYA